MRDQSERSDGEQGLQSAMGRYGQDEVRTKPEMDDFSSGPDFSDPEGLRAFQMKQTEEIRKLYEKWDKGLVLVESYCYF